MGAVYCSMGNLDEGIKCLMESRDINVILLGPDDEHTKLQCSQLATFQEHKNKKGQKQIKTCLEKGIGGTKMRRHSQQDVSQ